MKTISRFLFILAVSIGLGLAAYAIIQPADASAVFSRTANPSMDSVSDGAQARSGHPGGHPQGGIGGELSTLALAFGKFLATLIILVALRIPLRRMVSRGGKGRVEPTVEESSVKFD